MRFVGRGHEAIRATHGKTLELSGDADITARATCIVAVSAVPQPPDAQVVPLAGPVRITIRGGGQSFTLRARANSSWVPGGAAVIRRSPLSLPGTLATHADAAAADLPRALVAVLRDPGAVVEVTVEPVPTEQDTLVLFAADPSRAGPSRAGPSRADTAGVGDLGDARLAAEIAAAGQVEAQDAAARELVAGRRAGASGPRHLVVAATGLPRAPRTGRPTAIETVGLIPALAAAVAAGPDGALVLAPDGAGDGEIRALLRQAPSSARIVLACPADRVDELRRRARQVRGSADAVLAPDWAPPRLIRDGDPADTAGADVVHLCLLPVAGGGLDPGVRAAIEALLRDGTSTRTAATALATLTGWPRRRAYDTVLGMTHDAR